VTTEASGSFGGALDRHIFWRSWTPEDVPARAVIVLVHGLGEHSGRYAHVVARLVGEGYAVHTADHRGHGRSDGPRALIENMDYVVADVDTLVDRAVAAEPGVPVFMLGHSMGGLIALRYALAHQDRLAGLILSAALAQLEAVPRPLELVGRALSVIAPRAPLIAIDPALVSRDPPPSWRPTAQIRWCATAGCRLAPPPSSPTPWRAFRRRSAPSPCRRSSSTVPPTGCALRRAA